MDLERRFLLCHSSHFLLVDNSSNGGNGVPLWVILVLSIVTGSLLLLLMESQKEKYISIPSIKLVLPSANKIKDYSTAGSQVVSKLSTGAARRCLTSQIGRDEVLSP